MLNLLMSMKRQGISLGKNTEGQPLWLPHWIRQASLERSTKMGTGGQTSPSLSHRAQKGRETRVIPWGNEWFKAQYRGMREMHSVRSNWRRTSWILCVWCINHSTEPTPKRLQPYGNNGDRCPPVCALDSLSDTIRSTQIQHAMMIIVLSN